MASLGLKIFAVCSSCGAVKTDDGSNEESIYWTKSPTITRCINGKKITKTLCPDCESCNMRQIFDSMVAVM